MSIKLDIDRATATELAAKATFIVERMTNNTSFTTPQPALATITQRVDDLKDAITAALDGGKTATAVKKARVRDLKNALRQLGGYVRSVAGRDEEMILSSGFGVIRPGTPLSEPGRPTNLRAQISEHVGHIDLAWTPVPEALTYHILHNESDPTATEGWTLVGVSTRATFAMKGLPSGRQSHFKVAGIGTKGMGPWSQVASSLVK